MTRAKDGTIPQGEVKETARTVSDGRAGRDLYRLLYAVAPARGIGAGQPEYPSRSAMTLMAP